MTKVEFANRKALDISGHSWEEPTFDKEANRNTLHLYLLPQALLGAIPFSGSAGGITASMRGGSDRRLFSP
ncbi:MAG TPA: hypothetical protein VNH11_26905 [Pirellulales bacterium]|nr:hypothetical protein [Pirellulales bacterium]